MDWSKFFGYILATMILAIFGTFCEGLPDFRYFASKYNSLPLVAYTKAIEVWTGVSLFGHFGHFWHLLGRNSRFLIFCHYKQLPVPISLLQSKRCIDWGKFCWPFLAPFRYRKLKGMYQDILKHSFIL